MVMEHIFLILIHNVYMKKGFTLVEILVIVAIIALLSTAILVSIEQSKRNARMNGAKTSLKTILPAIVACVDGGGAISPRVANTDICSTSAGLSNAKWPALSYGYSYGAGIYNSTSCNFKINTGSDMTPLGNTFITCSCLTQICE